MGNVLEVFKPASEQQRYKYGLEVDTPSLTITESDDKLYACPLRISERMPTKPSDISDVSIYDIELETSTGKRTVSYAVHSKKPDHDCRGNCPCIKGKSTMKGGYDDSSSSSEDSSSSEEFELERLTSDDELTREELIDIQSRIFKSLSSMSHDDESIDITEIDDDDLTRMVNSVMSKNQARVKMLDSEDAMILKTRKNKKYH